LGKVETVVKKLRTANLNVEKNRMKFPHVDDRELASRRAIVEEIDRVCFNFDI
jgi:hypothetical protein